MKTKLNSFELTPGDFVSTTHTYNLFGYSLKHSEILCILRVPVHILIVSSIKRYYYRNEFDANMKKKSFRMWVFVHTRHGFGRINPCDADEFITI